jgi:hypothetical protein
MALWDDGNRSPGRKGETSVSESKVLTNSAMKATQPIKLDMRLRCNPKRPMD